MSGSEGVGREPRSRDITFLYNTLKLQIKEKKRWFGSGGVDGDTVRYTILLAHIQSAVDMNNLNTTHILSMTSIFFILESRKYFLLTLVEKRNCEPALQAWKRTEIVRQMSIQNLVVENLTTIREK